ncbi:MAG: hypothetical protein ABEI11_01515 [Haloarculaceae archaeon]
MSQSREPDTPRAVIHKRILDVAADQPDASMAAIADEITGATTDLVERVLDEYGDPCRQLARDGYTVLYRVWDR